MQKETLKKYVHPINPDGWIFVIIFAVITLLFYSFSDIAGNIGVIATLWCIYFFRDPKRCIPQEDNLIVAPADGIVSDIRKVLPPEELELEDKSERTRVSIFLSVIDVHVNRTPVEGTIDKIHYHAGKFLSAELDKASDENERNTIVLTGKDGKQYIIVQIAGMIARRIICSVKEGQNIEKGERIGHIRFGSRVDVYLPEGVNPTVAIGQRALGGETILADTKRKAKKLIEIKEV